MLYSPGSYDTDPSWWQSWMKRWPPERQTAYDSYLTQLSQFPILTVTGGPAQRLLWPGPVGRQDRMVLAAVPATAAPSGDGAIAKPAESR